jgi:hypothetical protein
MLAAARGTSAELRGQLNAAVRIGLPNKPP